MAQMVNEEDFELLERVEAEEEVDEVDLDLSHWEFVCTSDDDPEESNQAQQQQKDDNVYDKEDENGDNGTGSSSLGDPTEARGVNVDGYGYGDDDGEEAEDDDDDDGLYGLDEKLVPWSMREEFGGSQRMRKLRKRGFTKTKRKMFNSKRSHSSFARTRFVRGKHGLGLEQSPYL